MAALQWVVGAQMSQPSPDLVPPALDELARDAIKRAQETQNLEDLERAATVAKSIAEARKASVEATTQRAALRQEGLKQWSQLLVPFLSVLTLAVALITQTLQQRDAERNRRNEAWRATVDEFRDSPTRRGLSALTAQARLRPFLQSKDYGQQANQLAMLIVPELSRFEEFQELFDLITWDNLNQIVMVNRKLSGIAEHIYAEIKSAKARRSASEDANRKASVLPSARVPPPYNGPLESIEEQMESDATILRKEAAYVCAKFVEAAKVKKLLWGRGPYLNNAWFPDCDLSGIDFSGADLTEADFSNTNLSGTHFSRVTQFGSLLVENSNWWDVADISAPLLDWLINYADPGSGYQSGVQNKPSKGDYFKKVKGLCNAAGLVCPDERIKYTERPEKTAAGAP
jgi:hypothetical protein